MSQLITAAGNLMLGKKELGTLPGAIAGEVVKRAAWNALALLGTAVPYDLPLSAAGPVPVAKPRQMNDVTYTTVEQLEAMRMRAAWMRAIGMADAEIAEHTRPELGPFDYWEELENLKAAQELPQNMLSRAELSKIAAQYPSWIDGD
jgi:hypothetical protein